MADYPGTIPSIETTTSGQLMSAVGHSDLHDQVGGELVAGLTALGVNPFTPSTSSAAGPWTTVKARLDAECILRTTSVANPAASTNVDRISWWTDTKQLRVSDGTNWVILADRDKFRISSTANTVGINQTSPEATLHIRQASGQSEPTVVSSEVIRGVHTSSTAAEAHATLIGGTAGASRLVLGDTSTRNRASVSLNASTGELEFATGGTVQGTIKSTGQTAFRKDGAGAFPSLGTAVVLGVIRTGTCTLAQISDATGIIQHTFGTEASPTLGMIKYDVGTDVMSLHTNASEAQRWYSSGRTLIIKGGLGAEPTWNNEDSLRVQRNSNASDSCAIQAIGGASGMTEVKFGTGTNGAVAKISHNNSTKELSIYTDGAETLRVTPEGRAWLRRGGTGSSWLPNPGETLRVQNDALGTDSVAVQFICGDTGNSNLYLGTGANPTSRGQIWYSMSNNELRFNIRNNGASTRAMTFADSGGANAPIVSAQGIYDNTTASAASVFVTTGGVLQRSTSARKYKTSITPVPVASAYALVAAAKAVTFESKVDAGAQFLGMIADDIAEANPLAGIFNDDGEVENYDQRSVLAVACTVISDLAARVAALETA